MTIQQISHKLVDYCKAGKNLECIRSLYADNIESVEAAAMPNGERITKGKDGVLGKNKWWEDNHEIHSAKVEGPWPHGDAKFAVRFSYDVTNKTQKQRMQMDEIAVFTVKDDKIVKEEFFYDKS
ncbi:MAG: nuclear transport factor 2 family protein [Myxococcales bacterium]